MDLAAENKELKRRLASAEEALRSREAVEAQLAASERGYRALFQTMGQGYSELDLIRDDNGRVIDYRHVALNPAFERLTGLSIAETLGRTARETLLYLEPWWLQTYERIVASGEPERFEYPVGSLDRWYEVFAYPRTGDSLSVLFEDISIRKRAERALQTLEERHSFLLELSDAIRPLADAGEIQAMAARLLARHLGVDRAMYGEVTGEPGAEIGVIRGQFVRPAEPERPAPAPFPDRFSFESFGAEVMARRYSGEGLVVADVDADPAFDAGERAAWAMVGVRAAIVAPLVKNGRLVAELGLHSETPRAWTDTEVLLVREVGERTWAAAERAKSAAALHESEERFRQFADAAAEGAWIRDARTLEMEYVSPAAVRIFGVKPCALLDGVHHWASLTLPEDRDAALANLEDARSGKAVTHEYRIRRPSDGAFRWIRSIDFPLFDTEGRVQRIGGLAEDVTEVRLAVEHQGVLLAELQHRVRNIMAMIRSMARRSSGGAADVGDYKDLLEGRLLALARVQALLTRQANAGGTLRDIVESEVAAQAHHGGQFELDGPEIQLSPKAVEVLTLALHELSTNALKYGALSVAEGRLRVEWAPFEKGGRTWLRLDWIEEGGPSRGPVTRRGFGSDLIEGKIPYELGGTGKVSFEPGGARCRLEFPLKEGESILETDAPSPTAVFGGTLDMAGAPNLTGRTVLVVEDDYYIAADTAAALRGAGAIVLGPCPSEEATLDLLETATPTHAVLDLNLGGGGPQFAIAHALKARGVPFIFLTGYDPDAVPPDLAGIMRLQKPIPLREIVEAVGQL